MLKYFLACGRWKTKTEREIKAGGTKRAELFSQVLRQEKVLFHVGSQAHEEGLDGLGGREEVFTAAGAKTGVISL